MLINHSGTSSSSSSSAAPPQVPHPESHPLQGVSLPKLLKAGPPQPIEGFSIHPNAAFVQRQKTRLLKQLVAVLNQVHMLPPLVELISDYAMSILTTAHPLCLHLFPERGFLFTGFSVGYVGANRENALFLTRTSDRASPDFRRSTAYSQLIRIEEEGGSFVSRTWETPYNDSYNCLSTVHTVQTGERSFYFENDNTIGWARESDGGSSLILSPHEYRTPKVGVAVYDPWSMRVWKTKFDNPDTLVGLTSDMSKEIRCTPTDDPTIPGIQNVLFASVVSPTRLVSVHWKAICLFSTIDVDRNESCQQMDRYTPLESSFSFRRTITSIPRSTRFIAALYDKSIIYFNPDLEQNRIVVQKHDVVPMTGSTDEREILNVAANSTAAALVQDITPPGSLRREDYWDCGVSLLDHESASEISHFNFPQKSTDGLWCGLKSWLTENNVVIMSYEAVGTAVNSLSMIDFRVQGGKVSYVDQ